MGRSAKGRMVVTDATRAVTICTAGQMANTFRLRLFGLLGRRAIDEDGGLLIKPSSGVHTFGMMFPIDIVSLDKQNRVVGTWESIGPWKIRGLSLRTHSVLELAAGKIRQCGIEAGDQILIQLLP